MQNRVQKMLKRFFADKLKRRRLTAVVSALSVLVVVGVFLQLMQPVITMTPDPVCGKEAHAHGDACYEQLLTCTSAEEGHVHGEACYANTLTCGKEAHEHVDACYPETVEEPTVPPTEEPTAVVTEAPAATSEPEESEAPSKTDGSAEISAQTEEGDEEVQPTEEAAGEATAEPTEEAAGEATAEPTEEAAGEATAEPTEEAAGEATAEPTEEVTSEATAEPTEEATGEATVEPTEEAAGEATAEPTEEATAEPTEEPTVQPTEEVVVPLTLDGLTADVTAAKVGEAITWQFSAAGAEKIEYVIVDEAGSVMAGSELTANHISWTASHAGKYTIIVTAYAGEEVASVSGEVTAQDTAELTASVWSDALYCFAGQDVTFNLARSGETEITACEITVVQNGKVLDSRTEFAETVTVTTEAQSNVTDVTLTLTLTDASGAVVTATHTIPCPVKVTETEAEWRRAADIGELSGVWANDLLAIAKKQIGYFESDVNFIINEEGRHGYTRYGDWYGQPYREWCAMFLSYCLEYAEVPEEYIPRHASSSDWMDELRYLDLFSYRTAEDCEPAAGDLIFFDWNEDGVPEHIGMVSEATETMVYTIEGNAEAAVRAREYAKGDKQILGYGLVTKAYEQYVEDITPDEDMSSVSGRTGVITAGKANLRAAADASSERIDTLTEGAAVSILSAEQNEDGFWWYQLTAGELTGYVRSDLVALDEVVPTAEPTAEPTPEPTPEPTAEPTPAPTEEPVDPNTLYGSLMLQVRALTAPEQPAADADEETLAAYQAAQAKYEADRAALTERILISYASTDLTDEEYRKLDAALTGAPEPTAAPSATPEATFAPTLEPTAEPTPTPAPNPVQVSMEIEAVDEEAKTANIIMTAALTGIRAEDYLWQWQVSATGEEPWENIEGATELTLTIPLSEDSYNAFYRIYGDYIEPAEAAEPQVTAEPTAPAEQTAAYDARTMSLSTDEQPAAGEGTTAAQTFAITTGGDVASDANTPAVASVDPSEDSATVDVYLVPYVSGVPGTPVSAGEYPLTNSRNTRTSAEAIFNSINGTNYGRYEKAYMGTESDIDQYVAEYVRYRYTDNTPNMYCYESQTEEDWVARIRGTDELENYSLYIYYTPNDATVTFNYDGGTDSEGNTGSTAQVTLGEKLSAEQIPTVTKDGYNFDGWVWSVDSKTYTDSAALTQLTIDADTTFTAQWFQPTITFDLGDYAAYITPLSPMTVPYNKPIGTLPKMVFWTDSDIDIEPQMLVGWQDEYGNVYDGDECLTDNITLYAIWGAAGEDAYFVQFCDFERNADGGGIMIATVVLDKDASIPYYDPGMPPSGYTWDKNWYYEDGDTLTAISYTEPVSTYAEYMQGDGTDKRDLYLYPGKNEVRRVSFDTNGGSPVAPADVAVNSEFNPYSYVSDNGISVVRTGYAFAGWYEDAELTDRVAEVEQHTISEPKVYYAKWTPTYVKFMPMRRTENANDTGFVTAGTIDENGWYAYAGSRIVVVTTGNATSGYRHQVMCDVDLGDGNGVARYPVLTDPSNTGSTVYLDDAYNSYFLFNNSTMDEWLNVFDTSGNDKIDGTEKMPYTTDVIDSSGTSVINFDYMRVRVDLTFRISNENIYTSWGTGNNNSGTGGGHFDIAQMTAEGGVLEGSTGVTEGLTSGNFSAEGTLGTVKWVYTAVANDQTTSGNNTYVLKGVKYGQSVADVWPTSNGWITLNDGSADFWCWEYNDGGNAQATRILELSSNFISSTGRNAAGKTLDAVFVDKDMTAVMYAVNALSTDTENIIEDDAGNKYVVLVDYCEILNASSISQKTLYGYGEYQFDDYTINEDNWTRTNEGDEVISENSAKTYFTSANYFASEYVGSYEYASIFLYSRNKVGLEFVFDTGNVEKYEVEYGSSLNGYWGGAANGADSEHMTKTGYRFKGWRDADGNEYLVDEDGEEAFNNLTVNIAEGAMVFYAIWEEVTNYYVEFYADDTTATPISGSYFKDGDSVTGYLPGSVKPTEGWYWINQQNGATKMLDGDDMYHQYGKLYDEYEVDGETVEDLWVIKVYGKWKEGEISVVYDINEGEGGKPENEPEEANTVRTGVLYSVKAPVGTPVNENPNKTFVGWKMDKTDDVIYQPGDHVGIKSSWSPQITFIAQWSDDVVYLKYNPNGGTPNDEYPNETGNAYARGATANVWDNMLDATTAKYSKAGYKFVGWNTEADGSGTDYAPNSTIELNLPADQQTMILYAQWEPTVYSMMIKKVGTTSVYPGSGETEKIALIGAKFSISEKTSDGWSVAVEYETNSNGVISISSMTVDSLYCVTEVKAPNGYYPLTEKIYFKVVSNDGVMELKFCNASGEVLATAPDKVEGTLNTDGSIALSLEVTNTPGSELPSTGGAGTLPYTLGGLLMMAVSLVYGLGLKRRRERGTAE